jgi:release factor glutamine methyltransferase
MTGSITTFALLRLGTARLAGLPEPHLEAQLLLAHVLAVPRVHLLSHPEAARSQAECGRYLALLERRLAGEPVAYLVGHRDFWNLTLQVTPAVLVPRPETELLVERALALVQAAAHIADLGTGSGAIALALAAERPGWRVTATDASTEALAVARANALRLGLTVEFLHGAWFEPLAARRFEAILSNPPYVAADDPALVTLAAEPYRALTPGADALADLRHLIRGAPTHLEAGGWLALEHGADQAAAVRNELVARGFRHVRSHRDLGGHERVTEGQWPALAAPTGSGPATADTTLPKE